MEVYSPINPTYPCEKVGEVDMNELKRCYCDGIGLGLDLIQNLKDERIKIYQCPITKFKFFSPTNLAGDSWYYKELERRNSNYYKSDSWEFYETIKFLNNNAFEILEIGSGNLSFLKLVKRSAKRVVGLELNENAVRYGQAEGIEVHNTSIEEFSKSNIKKFDVVCAFQVLEHVLDIDNFIRSSLTCLRKNGRLIIAVPNNRSILFKSRSLLKYYSNEMKYKLHCTTIALNTPPHHMGLWTARSLKRLCKNYPMKCQSVFMEPIKEFRFGLIRDIIINYLNKFFGLRISKSITNRVFTDGLIKKVFVGDSILIIFRKQ